MSDTPKTDAACGWPWGHHGRIESSDLKCSLDGPFVHSSVARELERENAKLRNNFMFAESEIILLREDREELREKIAAMREMLINADELERYSGSDGRREWGKCSTWLHADDVVITVSAKAFDAIRKEAQP